MKYDIGRSIARPISWKGKPWVQYWHGLDRFSLRRFRVRRVSA